jgi:hypothetical protein
VVRLRTALRYAAAAFVVGLTLMVSVTTASAAEPAPYPAEGGSPLTWSCDDRAADPLADPPIVAGSECVVTEWGTDPVPDYPEPGVAGSVLTDQQDQVITFALGLLVFFAAAHTIGSWR